MKIEFKKILIIIFILLILPITVLADNYGLDVTANVAGLKNADIDVMARTEEIINAILGFLGFIMVCLIIYSGFMWMTSTGNEEKITKAKNTLKASIIGFAIIMLAWVIITVVWGVLVGEPIFSGGTGVTGGINVPH
ncbi:MAG: pilin [Patescibacteria group bacterium]|nr:pilin [Patescibacteria group bacterium]